MKRIISVLLIAMLVLTGCRQTHDLSAKLKSGVPSRLTGVWTIVAGGESRRSGFLELRSNGKFVAKNLPDDILEDVDKASDRLLTGTGDWSFERDTEPRHVLLTFHTLQGGDQIALPLIARFDLEENRQTLQLSVHIGDPDEDEHLALELTDAGEGTVK